MIRDAPSSLAIRSMDMPIIDRVFGMEEGFALNFSNRTFAEFFRDELNVNIDNPYWGAEGGSKAKRLRYYLGRANRKTALDTLNALWECHEASGVTTDRETPAGRSDFVKRGQYGAALTRASARFAETNSAK